MKAELCDAMKDGDSAVSVAANAGSGQQTGISRFVSLLFVGTCFLSAFLLFQVQLIVSKCILPWFGGSAAVWSTSLLVFQLLLLCGYVYSHVLSVKLSRKLQMRFHIGLLSVVSLIVLVLQVVWPSAITPPASWKTLSAGSPVLGVCMILLSACGLPFFVLATTGPLLQRWYAHLGSGSKTYKLYSISNLGSLLGLLSFPFLFEPLLRLRTQGILWALFFLLFAVGSAICAKQASSSVTAEEDPAATHDDRSATNPNKAAHALWFLLPAIASALLLSTTNLLCQEVTSVPLLWVLPLSLYLVTFILSFDHPRWYQRAAFHPIFIVGVFLICGALVYDQPFLQLVTLPILLFAGCMICHGELVRIKPGVEKLTSFYLAISAGGAAGGIFVALVAPRIFTFFTEFQVSLGGCILLALVCLYLDRESWFYAGDIWRPLGIGTGAIIACAITSQLWSKIGTLLRSFNLYPIAALIVVLVVLGAYVFRENVGSLGRFRFVQVLPLAIAVLSGVALIRSTQPLPGLFFSSRNFYGTVLVFDVPHGRMLVHGRTIHGGQFEPPFDKEPATYYGRESGIGAVMMRHPKRGVGSGNLRVEMVGLGSGSLAAYGRPGDYFRYYEIDPKVIELSTAAKPVFTYVRDSSARVDMMLGDARLLMERETFAAENEKYDVVVVDAFSGDAIPVHLLTREAFDIYWQHLRADTGIIAVHISSRHLNLLPVVQGAAKFFHADSLTYFDNGGGPMLSNCWVLLARKPGVLSTLGLDETLPPNDDATAPRLWTDDYSSVIGLIRR